MPKYKYRTCYICGEETDDGTDLCGSCLEDIKKHEEDFWWQHDEEETWENWKKD